MTIVRIAMTSSNNPSIIIEALRSPSPDFFKDIPGIVSFRSYRDLGIYELKIRLRRFLAIVVDTINFTVRVEGNRVLYESLEPEKFRAIFSVSEELGITSINAEISYNTPLKGSVIDTAVNLIFRRFIWNLDQIAPTIVKRISAEDVRREEAVEKPATTIEAKERVEKPTEVGGKAIIGTPTIAAGGINCKTCLLYEASVSICTYFMKKVEDPGKPLCGGDKYIKA